MATRMVNELGRELMSTAHIICVWSTFKTVKSFWPTPFSQKESWASIDIVRSDDRFTLCSKHFIRTRRSAFLFQNFRIGLGSSDQSDGRWMLPHYRFDSQYRFARAFSHEIRFQLFDSAAFISDWPNKVIIVRRLSLTNRINIYSARLVALRFIQSNFNYKVIFLRLRSLVMENMWIRLLLLPQLIVWWHCEFAKSIRIWFSPSVH